MMNFCSKIDIEVNLFWGTLHVVNCPSTTTKNNSNDSSDMHKLHAVALTEPSAALVSFQRHQPSLPLTQNVDSAPRSLTSACHFSGSIAICAKTATFTTHIVTALNKY
jgi:hypothetical protein